MRAQLQVLVAVLAAATAATAAPITNFTYDFTGAGTTVNPGAFGPSAVSPLPPMPIVNPTLTASAGPATATVSGNVQNTNAVVVQTAAGLGVSTRGFRRVAGINIFGTETPGVLGGAVVDGVGLAIVTTTNGTTAELLTLTYTETDPNLVNSQLTSLTFDNTLDFGPGDDFALFKNNVLVGNFDLPGAIGPNTFTLPTPLGLSNGDTLTLVPLVTAGGFNFFSLRGANIQAEVIPEPATLAVFGGIALAGALGYRRRKSVTSV